MKARSIEDLVQNYILQDKVPAEEFLVILEEIRRTLHVGKGKFQKIYQLIAADTEQDNIDDCTVRYYHNKTGPVPTNIYHGAINTLRWAYKTAGKGSLPLRVRNMLEIIEMPRKGKESPETPRLSEAKTPTPPAKKQKKTKTKPTEPRIYKTSDQIQELADILISAGAYKSIQDIEDDLRRRNLCKEGGLITAYNTGGSQALYTNLEGLAILHNCSPVKSKQQYTDGKVPGYALDGLLLRAMELYADKDSEPEDKLGAVEKQMKKRRLCKKGELTAAEQQSRETGSCSSRLFDSLVMLLRDDPLKPDHMLQLRTLREYDPSNDYEIGQLLKIPRTTGIVIDREYPDRIIVYLHLKDIHVSAQFENPTTLRVNVNFDRYRKKNRDNYDGI